MTDVPRPLPAQTTHAYPVAALRVVSGANLGDPIAPAGLVAPGDIYRLDSAAQPLRLMLHPEIEASAQRLAEGTAIGEAGDLIRLASLLTLMAPDGDLVELLIVHHEASGADYAAPLSPMAPRVDYTLIDMREDVGEIRIADVVCVSFAAGTMITLPGGAQRPIESLQVGDEVLTRDHGAQQIRWIGQATFRAKGAFAPIVIATGVLGNQSDLIVSPHHRIFIYQRGAHRVGGTAELLVQAKHLVDDTRITRREGGFIDYYSLVFDRHEIVYAEGVPAESLLVTDATVNLLPRELADEVRERFPGLSQTQHFGTEVGRELLDEVESPLRGRT